MPPKDPYKVLGVDRKASQEDIKKAYRKLARELHPDRNPGDATAEERFKEVQQAYDLVGDPEKRKQHDRGGSIFGGAGRPGPGGGFDAGSFGDILSDLFGRRGQGGPTGPQQQRGRDLEVATTLSFADAMKGTTVSLTVPTSQMCGTCRGTGAKPGTSPTVCPRCSGRGVESQGQGLFSISTPCPRCQGQGTVIDDPCPTCRGAGATRTEKTYKVAIPAGIKDGARVRVAGKGEPGRNGGSAGDLFVVCKVQRSGLWERKGDDVELEVPLTIPEALRGADVEVPTLNGRKKLRVPPGTRSGTVQRLRGEGPPKPGQRGRGDIRYRFVIDVPEVLTAEQSQAVDRLSQVLDGNPRARLFEEVA
jgi:molecular chaperone DnaJ